MTRIRHRKGHRGPSNVKEFRDLPDSYIENNEILARKQIVRRNAEAESVLLEHHPERYIFSIPWSDLDIPERLKAIRAELKYGSDSAQKIAIRLGASRNAIVGFCWRQGIKLPGTYHAPKGPLVPVNNLAYWSRTQCRAMSRRELKALIREHTWFAREIMAGRGSDGLPRLDGRTG